MSTVSILGVQYKPITDSSTLTRGDIIWTPQSNMLDCIAYLIVDIPNGERPFGLTNMVGYKAGLRLVSFPKECKERGKDLHGISFVWIKNNWDEWVALGKFEDAIFLRYAALL